MSDVIEQFEAHGCSIGIHYDEDASSPREDDNLGTIVHWHRRYDFGENIREQGPEEFLRGLARSTVSVNYTESLFEKRWEEILAKHFTVLPVCLLDHSGLHIWVGNGSHWSDPGGWDSGQVGFIYCSLETARANWLLTEGGHPHASWDFKIPDWYDDQGNYVDPKILKRKVTLRKATERGLEAEIKEYDQYLRGEVYGYVIKGHGEEESCWGFIGDIDYVKREAISAAARFRYAIDCGKLTEEGLK